MLPVHIIHLYLHEIPMILLMQFHEFVEDLLPAVERKTQITDSSCLTLCQKEIQQSVIYISVLEYFIGTAYGMEKIVVEIIGAESLHGIVVHLQTGLAGRIVEIRELRRNIISITGIATQRQTCGSL